MMARAWVANAGQAEFSKLRDCLLDGMIWNASLALKIIDRKRETRH
jgi:hypothetical protein